MRHEICWMLVSALLLPAPALAADAAAPLAPVHRLSEGEIDRILDQAAAKREPVGSIGEEIDGERPPPQVHGEVGFGIGTNGYRSAFGSAVVPFDDGFAAFSFDRTNLGSTDVPIYERPYNR